MNLLNLSLIKIISGVVNYLELLEGSISKPSAGIEVFKNNL
jgi:hypothetical protein